MLLEHKDLVSEHSEGRSVYNGPNHWMRLPDGAIADRRVIEEAQQLAQNGFPRSKNLFVHGTGSAAMADFAKYQAISSARSVLQRGDKVMTGDYVSHVSGHDGQTSQTGGAHGLGNVYTSRDGMSYTGYTMQRWFDETPVTFGISEEKQRAYNKKTGIERSYVDFDGEGIVVGPRVPLENVIAISAPKEQEARTRAWIGAHCPHAQFVSYEAATLLEDKDIFGLLQRDR